MSNKVDASLHGDLPTAAAAEALCDRRELALVAFERTRMPMVVTDPRLPNHPIVLANQAFLDLTGYSVEEVIGSNCRFLQGPQTSTTDVDVIREALSRGEETSVELLNYRKDGSVFWNQLAISPVRAEDGELLYYFGSQKDVTEQRRAQELEAAERLLLMEVDHRTMNAMALVQSIVRLSRSNDTTAYAATIQGRVDALARAHRLLAKGRWSDAEFSDVLGLGATPYQDRIDADGPPMPISAKVVQPIALVLHEMLSNAVSHGALVRSEGAVIIRWRAEADKAIVSWRERGGAIPRAQPRPGFGLNMIEGVIARQLGGAASLRWTDEGLDAELVFPRAGMVRV
jgi:PAS domain S-box-containing protein